MDTKHDLAQVDLTKEALDKPVDQFTMAVREESVRRRRVEAVVGKHAIFRAVHRREITRTQPAGSNMR